MYAINLDFDPTTVGFKPAEISKNEDGTYTVTRRFVDAVHRDNVNYNYYELKAYCPCSTDELAISCFRYTDSKMRMYFGVSYSLNGGEQYSTETKNWSNNIVDYWNPIGPGMVNKKYGTHIEDYEEEKAIGFMLSMINGHPNNINERQIREYYEKYHIVFNQYSPDSPEKDPFLPVDFRKMITADT